MPKLNSEGEVEALQGLWHQAPPQVGVESLNLAYHRRVTFLFGGARMGDGGDTLSRSK